MNPSLLDLWLPFDNHSDKGDAVHTFENQSYLHVYERYFEARRSAVTKLLEIGVRDGFSLRLWRDYFPNAHIHGLDIDPVTKSNEGDRITVHIGDQNNTVHLALLTTHGPFDIIIDDGSHVTEHIVTSFDALWPHITPNGLYCIEDTRCTYHAACGSWPGMNFNATLPRIGQRDLLDKRLQEIIHDLDHLTGSVRALHIHPMQIIIEKV